MIDQKTCEHEWSYVVDIEHKKSGGFIGFDCDIPHFSGAQVCKKCEKINPPVWLEKYLTQNGNCIDKVIEALDYIYPGDKTYNNSNFQANNLAILLKNKLKELKDK